MGNIAEKLIAAGKRNVKAMSERGEELLNAVKIPVHRMKEEPRKFSGGMQQRVQIAKLSATIRRFFCWTRSQPDWIYQCRQMY